MISLKLILAIAVGKTILAVNKLTGSGGTAAPGLVALKICPDLVKKLGGQLDKNILITGTNGKTTTARMAANILKEAKINYLHNRVGSNLLRGVASTLVKNSSIFGKIDQEYWGLWETDEAAFPIISSQVKPQIVLITNLFRDQLDRYGEINTLASKWKKTLLKLPQNSTIILNADDSTVASLGKDLKHKVAFFGVFDPKLPNRKLDHASDATACPYCASELSFKKCYVGHMGEYHCKNCGAIQPKKDFIFPKCIETTTPGVLEKLKKNIPGNYNSYNLTAAFALTSVLKINKQIIIKGLLSFKSAFGRVEKIKAGQKTINLYLVKNPTGFNEVIETLIQNKKKITPLIVINDLIADGTDVSWLWDVNFEKLVPYIKEAIVSGTRADDMALRLKYTTFFPVILRKERPKDPIVTIQPDLKKAVSQLLSTPSNDLYILPTYTAMLKVRKILNKMGLVHSSWKD